MSMLDTLHFLRPAWLSALVALPLLWWLWRRRGQRANPWRRVVDPHLLPALTERDPSARTRSPGWLIVTLPLLAILALAGPAWHEMPQPLLQSDSALVIAVDLSDRMRAADLAPDRLQRARFKLMDLLRNREDGQVGLVAYAGDAFTVAPLTNDYATLQSLLASLEPDVMPVAGQRADRAIRWSARLIEDAGFSDGRILLLTDRVDAAAIDAAKAARQRGIRVSVLGVGTEQGAPVPLAGGSFANDEHGKPLMAALDRESLSALAEAGGGGFSVIGTGPADLHGLDVLAPAGGSAERASDDDVVPRFRDEGPWLVLLLLPLAAIAFRRGWLGCLPLLLCLPAGPAQAFDWDALWWRDEQRAQQALERGDHERARALASDPARQGSAAYRAGDFAAAIDAFARNDNADADYNRGNALARAGQLEQAIAAYDDALAQQPGMDDAIANRAAVEALLEQRQQQQQQQQDQSGSGGQPQDQTSSGESGKPEQDAAEPAPAGDPAESPPDASGKPDDEDTKSSPQDGQQPDESSGGEPEPSSADPEAAQAEQDALKQQIDQALQQAPVEPQPSAQAIDPAEREQAQATEQLLRRVPDDPGGLLRRKFAIEHRQRMIEEQGDRR